MALRSEAPIEIRCTCSREPLLARGGIKNGKQFLHLKHMKASKILVDVQITGGSVQIVCRECFRVWTLGLNGPTLDVEKPSN